MESFNSYPKIYALGHAALADLLTVDVIAEEKVDGSQFSFGVDTAGEIHMRSKGAVIFADSPEKMFSRAVESVRELAPILKPGLTYRAEYLQKPKHNVLAYSRVPEKHLIVFDIACGIESYLSYEEKVAEAKRVGLECVPLLFSGKLSSAADVLGLLETTSALGGQKVEGVVIKPVGHSLLGIDKKPLLGKFVSEAFKEVHAGEWRTANPNRADVLEVMANKYRTPARWQKAVIHLKESGQSTGSPKDIGKLMTAVKDDVLAECEAEIRESLFKWAWPNIQRRVVAGLPEWYKQELLEGQFKED